ncbi:MULTISPECIES: staphyloferrin B export MFS transporter [Mammaliicoccus]|uniref:staphyloferrin B export MFS transporter n=1 Tax=Mammaliicoccus TaxID=2803850 RepID=UPI0018838EAD|nr:staphyloferrin B export MFS transporter [Mammaliicoccus lentus]MBF0840645.1 staphyloferrin B export MFS transporter [Mammaliicoccus lentus]
MTKQSIWRSNFRILWLSQFMTIAGLTVLVPLLPIYMSSLQKLSVVEVQLWSGIAIAAPAVTTMLVSPLWGKLGDKVSRKWMILRALFGLVICLFLMALCTTPLQFVLVRLLQGLFGGVVDASSAFASAEAPAEERGKVLGRLQSSVSAGSLVGPLIGGVTASLLGFSILLMGIAIMTFILCVFVAFRLIETSQVPKSQKVGINKGIRRTFQCLLCTQKTCRFIIVGVLANFAMYGMLTALSPLASSVNHTAIDNRSVVGFLQTAFWTASILSAPIWGRFNDKAYVKTVYIVATIICGCSVILQGLATNIELLIAARILQGLTYSALIQSVMFVVVNACHQQLKGTFVGTTNSMLVIGQIVGSLSGAAITSYTNPTTTFVVMGVVFAVSSLFLICSTITNQINDQTLMKLWELKQKSAK